MVGPHAVKSFAVTFFTDYAAKTKTEESLTLEALAKRIRTTTARKKEDLPWLKFARFGSVPNPKSKSGSLRWNGNVMRLSGVLVDYDGERMSIDEAAERLDKAGIDAIVYCSPSHYLDGHGHRWRVGCPFSKELPPDAHYQMVSRLNGVLGGVLTTESWTLSQAFYFGSVNDNPAHEAIVIDGLTKLDQCDDLDEIAIGKPNGNNSHAQPGPDPKAEIGDIKAALAVIPNPIPSWGTKPDTWNEWNTIGMAVWRASGGTEEGLEAFDAWSTKWAQKYDAEETRFRWDHFGQSPPSQVGFGTLVHHARETKPGWVPPSGRKAGLPTISVEAGKRHEAADRGIAALVAAGAPFYQRNRNIVRIALVKAKASNGRQLLVSGIVQVDQPRLVRELGRSAYWRRWDGRKKDHVCIDPPDAVAAQILSMAGEWPFEPLQGIIECPTLRPDGSLLDAPGYDERTGLVLVNEVDLPGLSPHPHRDDADHSLDLLIGLLREFPFDDRSSEDNPLGSVSMAVALSMLITPVVRGAMSVAPMHLVTAPLPGTGKSYLLDCAAMISTGEVCAVESMAPKYEETEKRLIGAALCGFPIIAVDNVREIIAGDFFCQVIERPLMSLRALGSSEKHRIPNTFTIFADGNNATVAEDMVRRTLRCGMDANMEHPEKREFAFDPLAAIEKERGKYIAAALTIPLAYIAAGTPRQIPPLPSFGSWSRMVREPLIWLGCADPVASQAELRAADPQKEQIADTFEAFKTTFGTGFDARRRVADILRAAESDNGLREALVRIARKKRDGAPEIDPTAFGKWLKRHEGHIACGLKLRADRTTNASRPEWYVAG